MGAVALPGPSPGVLARPPEAGGRYRERRLTVTQALTENIRLGWKVFAGPDPIGEVAFIGDHEFGVKSGRLVKHEYVIPIDYVSDAADGVVDLKVGRDAVTKLNQAK